MLIHQTLFAKFLLPYNGNLLQEEIFANLAILLSDLEEIYCYF